MGKGLGVGGCHKEMGETSSTGTLQEQDGAWRGPNCWWLLGRLRTQKVAHDTGCVPSHLSPTVNPKARKSRVYFSAGMGHTEVLSLLKVL